MRRNLAAELPHSTNCRWKAQANRASSGCGPRSCGRTSYCFTADPAYGRVNTDAHVA